MSAMPTGSSDSSTCAPEVLSTLRTSACAHTAPKSPVLAPITAAGLSRRTLSGNGREAQSSAFFSAPGSEALYSGVAIRIASASSIASRRSWTAGGGVDSRSSSKAGRSRRPFHSTRSAPGGSASPAARSSLLLWEPRRRLPEMPRIRIGLGLLLLDEGEVDRQRDVVGEHVAARRPARDDDPGPRKRAGQLAQPVSDLQAAFGGQLVDPVDEHDGPTIPHPLVHPAGRHLVGNVPADLVEEPFRSW